MTNQSFMECQRAVLHGRKKVVGWREMGKRSKNVIMQQKTQTILLYSDESGGQLEKSKRMKI